MFLTLKTRRGSETTMNGSTLPDRQTDYAIAVEATERLRLAAETSLSRGDLGTAVVLTGLLRVGYADVLDFLERAAEESRNGGLSDGQT